MRDIFFKIDLLDVSTLDPKLQKKTTHVYNYMIICCFRPQNPKKNAIALPPIIMVQWKMGLSPILASILAFRGAIFH